MKGKYPAQRGAFVFSVLLPLAPLSAGQHISVCWNQPSVVSECVSSESPGSCKCSLSVALLPSLSALKAMTSFHCEVGTYFICSTAAFSSVTLTYSRNIYNTTVSFIGAGFKELCGALTCCKRRDHWCPACMVSGERSVQHLINILTWSLKSMKQGTFLFQHYADVSVFVSFTWHVF